MVSVRTVFGGRTARAFTNKFDEESLRQVVRSAESLARVQHPDADLLPMPDCSRAGFAGSAGGAPAPHESFLPGIFSRLRPLLLKCARRA